MCLGIRHFSEGERDYAELTFAKTSATDKGQKKKKANSWGTPTNYPRNNCGTLSVPMLCRYRF